MNIARSSSRPFNLKRYFFLLSLILMALVTLGMTLYLRHTSTEQLLQLEQKRASVLAKVIENSLWSSFYSLIEESSGDTDKLIQLSNSSPLRYAVIGLVQNTGVIKIKVYNLDGMVAFSTSAQQVGTNEADNPRFLRARNGETISELTHRESFDAIEEKLVDRDVISTYLPVYGEEGTMEGVFEIYVDATNFVQAIKEQQYWLTIGISILMLLLYLAQLLVVRRAAQILDSQAGALAATNRELDQHVEERTYELSVSNALLQEEIQERRKAEAQLERLARHDPLTGLPNRLMFSELLHAGLADTHLDGHNLTLLFIDLDHFKDVNDTLGHYIGDQLLKAVVTALLAGVRPGDTLTRFGGDEFVCILHDADDITITACANKLLGCFDEPFTIGGNKLHLSASIGICRAPQDGKDVETLVRNADIAMYQAKAAGRNRYEYYTQAMSAAVEERRWLEDHLRRAIENKSITVHFQAKIETNSGRLGGAEALVRWNDAALGLVPPGRFIPIAEETGLIVALGALVLEKTCQQIRAWLDAGFATPCVSVNVSVKQLEQDKFPERIAALLRQYDLPPSSLELEITESVIMAADDAIGMLERIHTLGVKLAIDDFGTGYSSLTYLKQLPVEVLKIDRAFIIGIGESRHDEAIIRTIISLASNLGLSTVAEGVEEENQVTFLAAAGCNLIQGYYYSTPEPAAEFSQRWLKNA